MGIKLTIACRRAWFRSPVSFGEFVDKLRERHPAAFATQADVLELLRRSLWQVGVPEWALPDLRELDAKLYESEHWLETLPGVLRSSYPNFVQFAWAFGACTRRPRRLRHSW